jgi:protein gp37
MGDLFHDAVPFEWIDRVLAMIALNPKHTFIILTKRPERMLEYFSDKDRWIFIEGRAQKLYHRKTGEDPSEWLSVKLPLPNLLPMTTICNQEEADRNIPFLLKTPAAMHGVSVEPMLGEISFGNSFYSHLMLLDLVVCGGESGAGARILNPDWVISWRDQCVEENTDFFFKQWGEYEYDKISQSGYIYDPKLRKNRPVNADDLIIGDYVARKVGKKKSGNRLHGEVWQQFPEVKG